MSTCKSCGARITWLTTAAGKAMLVDEDPVPYGNIVVVDGTRCRVLERGEEYDGPRYVTHFATCPQAPDWRR